MTTSDGKEYRMLSCFCGQQNSAGICSHIQKPYIEWPAFAYSYGSNVPFPVRHPTAQPVPEKENE